MSLKKLQMDADNPIFEEMTSDEQSEIASIFDTPQIDDKQNQQPISEIPLDNIRPSQHNRFEPYTGEKKQAMIDSIIENGIITPLTLRKTETSDIYEIISGENRWRCAREAGLESVPAEIRECSEEDAIMLLTEANLINRDVSFRERVIAYRQQYDVMKKKSGERSDLQADGEKVDSLDILAKKYGGSRTQMYRYIRTAELSGALITATGSNRIALDAAVKLTALDENAQAVVANYLEQTRCKIKGTGADEIVKAFNTNSLNFGSLDDIFESEDKKHKPITSIKITKFSKYFSGVRDSEYIEQTIEKALEMYFEHMEENLLKYNKNDGFPLPDEYKKNGWSWLEYQMATISNGEFQLKDKTLVFSETMFDSAIIALTEIEQKFIDRMAHFNRE